MRKVIPILLLVAAGFAAYWYFFQSEKSAPKTRPIIAVPGQEDGALFEQEIRTYRSMKYVLLKPINYDKSKKYPLVVCFHGGCPTKKISDPSNLRKPSYVYGTKRDFIEKNPCFILIPQATRLWWKYGKTGSLASEVPNYIDYHLMQEFPIDPARRYAIGNSDGGTGILHLLAWKPDYFAAAIPMAGWIVPVNQTKNDMKNMAQSKTAIWMFLGRNDAGTDWSVMKELPALFKRYHGNMKVTLANGGHAAPLQAFTALSKGKKVDGTKQITTGPACDIETKNPLKWMFKQRLDLNQ